MRFKRLVTTVDSHTEGEPSRVVIGGIPNIPGKTMAEKRDFVRRNLDYLRNALCDEPRGHTNMFTAILTAPVTEEAHFGTVMMYPGGYSDMCGHGAMGIATTAVETGIVEPREPVTEVVFDTPAGTVHARVNVEDGKAKSTTIQNIPSFLYKTALIKVPDLGEIPVDIAYGGYFYGIMEVKYLGLTAEVSSIQSSLSLIKQTIESINQQVKVKHPELDHVKAEVVLLLITDKPHNPKANTIAISTGPTGLIDRSPCGTGTCAKMATLYARGELGLRETYVTESVIGSLFYGELTKEVALGNFKAVVPEVTGRVFMTGIHNFVIDEDDPFKYGFKL
jgi:proline racemase